MKSGGMKFPVDILATVSQGELERPAQDYMTDLLYSNPDSPECLTLANSTQVSISIASVGFVPLYGSNEKQKVLALFAPSDPLTAVGLYLLGRWWTVDDILRTADPSRAGVLEVRTIGERIVLYLLNRVVYRAKEMTTEELPFLCHGEKESAKILWKNGEAVGFYSVKPTGSLFGSLLTRSYQLPVMDSIYVRKSHRGKGFGLQMLEDFVFSYKEDCLGLRYPLTKPMFKVCQKYLCQYPGDTDLLWEVENVGGPKQRTNIASKIQVMDLSAVSRNLSFTENSFTITEKDMEAQIQEHQSMTCTVEIVEEVTVLKPTKVSEEVPVATQTRSSGSKRRRVGDKITEDSKSENVIRIEDIEAETPKEVQDEEQQVTEDSPEMDMDKDMQAEAVVSMTTEEKAVDEVDAAPEEAPATMSENISTVLVTLSSQQNMEESTHYTNTQVEDASTHDLKLLTDLTCDTNITVENMASETEEEQKESENVVLIVSEEIVEVCKGAGVTDNMEEGTKGEELEETAEKLNAVQSEIPRRRSEHHINTREKDVVKLEYQDDVRTLRRRTVVAKPTPKVVRKRQKVCEESDNSDSPTAEMVESTVIERKDQDEDIAENKAIIQDVVAVQEELAGEDKTILEQEQTGNQDEPRLKESVIQESATELSDKTEVSDDDNPLQEEQSDESGLVAGGSAEEKVDEKATGLQEYGQMDQEEAIENTEEQAPAEDFTVSQVGGSEAEEAAEDVQPSTEMELEDKEVRAMENNEDAAESSTVQAVAGEEVQIFSSKLQQATVVLVDLKSTCHPLQVKEAEQTAGRIVKETSQSVVEESEMLKEDEGVEGENIESQEGDSVQTGVESTHKEESEVEKTAEERIEEEMEGAKHGEEALEEEGVVSETITENEEDTKTAADKITQEETNAEEQQSEEEAPHLSNIQRVTVVLLDVRKNGHKIQEETAMVELIVPIEEIAAETEDQQNELMEDETVEEKAPSFPAGKLDEKEMVLEEADTIHDTAEGKQSSSSDTCADGEVKTQDEENAEETSVTTKVDDEVEDGTVTETRALRRGKRAVTATPRRLLKRSKQNDEQEEEEAAAENSDEEEPAIKTRVLRGGRKSVTVIQRRKSRRSHKQLQEEEEEEPTTSAKLDEEKHLDDIEEPVTEHRTLRTRRSAVKATPTRKSTRHKRQEEEQEEVSTTDVSEPSVQTSVPRRGRKPAPVTPKHKEEQQRPDEEEENADSQRAEESDEGKQMEVEKEEQVEEVTKENTETESDVVAETENMEDTLAEEEAIVTEHMEEEDHVGAVKDIEETVVEETSSAEVQETDDTAKEEETLAIKTSTTMTTAEVGSDAAFSEKEDVADDTCVVEHGSVEAVNEAEKMEDASTMEESVVTVQEQEEAVKVVESDIEEPTAEETSSAEVDEASNTAEEEETLVVETSTTITATEVGPDTTVSEAEGVADDACTAAEKEQQEEENTEPEGTQAEAICSTDDSSEKREETDVDPPDAEQTKAEVTSAENEPEAPAADAAEDTVEETAELTDDKAVESTVSEEQREETEMESPNKVMSETKEAESVEPPLIEGRTLRSRTRGVADSPSTKSVKSNEEEEEGELSTRRSQRIKPVVNYSENDHEEADEMEADIDNKEEEDTVGLEEAEDENNESSENAQTEIPEENENGIEEKAEDGVETMETTGEEGGVQSSVSDADEEEETTRDAQEEDQSMSEEEPVVVRERVLRSRLIPSAKVTPLSKTPRSSSKGKRAEEILGASAKSPDSALKRNLRKRKSTELTPVCKGKRHNRK